MTSKNTTQNLKSISSEALDWAVIQKDMKNKQAVIYMKAGLERQTLLKR